MTNYRFLTQADVLQIPPAECPMIVLSDNMDAWISRRIIFWSNFRRHEKHRYSHAMELLTPTEMATQASFYRRESVASWLTDHIRLKFWFHKEWNENDRQHLRALIEHDLAAQWYLRIYDAPGIAGQWLHNVFGWGAWINLPGIHFCSARTARHLEPWTPGLERQPSPADLDRYFTESPHWAVYGVYDPREEECR